MNNDCRNKSVIDFYLMNVFIGKIVFIQQPNNKFSIKTKFPNVIYRYNYWKRCSFLSPSWLKDGNCSADW